MARDLGREGVKGAIFQGLLKVKASSSAFMPLGPVLEVEGSSHAEVAGKGQHQFSGTPVTGACSPMVETRSTDFNTDSV